jgi:AcrR family transcriptional regulator
MTQGERALRADAERNRRRVLDAAGELFRERGLEVGVGEIAEHAGVGRGTLFRNFPSKEALIAAILVDRMGEAVEFGQALLESADPGEALFEFLAEIVGRQQVDRAVFEAVADIWLANDEIRAAHAQIVGVLGELLGRAQEAGAVRADIGPMDVLMMFKGVCEAAASYAHIDAQIIPRHLDLLRAALRADPAPQPLRGRAPTLEEVERMALQSSEHAPATAATTTPTTAAPATTARAPAAAPATTAAG